MVTSVVKSPLARPPDPELSALRWLDSPAERLQQALRQLVQRGGAPLRGIKDLLHGTWLGHPLHAALTDLPVGAWTVGLLLDASGQRRSADAVVGLGTLAAVPAALAGLADWTDTEQSQRRVGFLHGTLNAVAFSCYLGSLGARGAGSRRLGVGLATLGYTLVLVSSWLGGELAYGLGTGVRRTVWAPPVPEFVPALPASELPEGRLTAAEIAVDGEKVPLVLLRRGDEVLALHNTCTHWGAPLSEGRLVDGDCVECPWHGSTFSLRDGSVVHGPAATPQISFEVRVRAGQVEVRRR